MYSKCVVYVPFKGLHMVVKNKQTHSRIMAKWLDLEAYDLVLAYSEDKWTWAAMILAWENSAPRAQFDTEL